MSKILKNKLGIKLGAKKVHISLISWSLSKDFKPFRTYLYLRLLAKNSGRVVKEEGLNKHISDSLSIGLSTVRRHLNLLIDYGFINDSDNAYYINNQSKIAKKMGLRESGVSEYNKIDLISDKLAYAYSVIMGALVKVQTILSYSDDPNVSKIGLRNQCHTKNSVSLTSAASLLGKSKGYIQKMKKVLLEFEYATIYPTIKRLRSYNGDFKSRKDESGWIFKSGNSIYKRFSDQIFLNPSQTTVRKFNLSNFLATQHILGCDVINHLKLEDVTNFMAR